MDEDNQVQVRRGRSRPVRRYDVWETSIQSRDTEFIKPEAVDF